LSELVLLLLNTDRLQQFEDFVRACIVESCPYLVEGQVLTEILKLLKAVSIGRSRTSSDKNLQIVESGQYFVEVEFQQFEDELRVCSTSTKY
jgi:hypothetical protein